MSEPLSSRQAVLSDYLSDSPFPACLMALKNCLTTFFRLKIS